MSFGIQGDFLGVAEFGAFKKTQEEEVSALERRMEGQEKHLSDLAKRVDVLTQHKFPINAIWSDRIILFSKVCAVVTVLGCVAYLINPAAVAALVRFFFQR